MKTRFLIALAMLVFSTCPLLAQKVGTAQLKVTSVCETDSIRFHVINIGDADLGKEIEYYVIEDEIIARGAIAQLPKGDSVEIIIHPKGSEVIFQVEQIGGNGEMIGQKVSNCGTVQQRKPKSAKLDQAMSEKLNNPWALGVYVGSLGPGVTISRHINNKITFRLGGTYAKVNLGDFFSLEGAESELKINLATMNFKMDYFVSNNPRNKFHLVFGGVLNFSNLEIAAKPIDEVYTIGNMEVNREDIGAISLTVRANKINPYFGLGFGRLANYNKRLGFKIELGGMYTGSPKVSLEASGLVEPTASQEEQINKNIRQYYIYPSVNVFMSVKL